MLVHVYRPSRQTRATVVLGRVGRLFVIAAVAGEGTESRHFPRRAWACTDQQYKGSLKDLVLSDCISDGRSLHWQNEQLEIRTGEQGIDYILEPLIDGVIVDQHGFYLECSKEEMVGNAIVNVEGDERLFGSDIASDGMR